ncbi:MAG: hypothetical protein EHM28_06760 [Spirochaetaceae bacterium]|nr:MAG: hypothetical protein EHM28_06760 [Spirochaetaceae bacterium]
MISERSRKRIILVISILVPLAILLFFLVQLYFFQSAAGTFGELMQKADNLISGGYLEEAKRILVRATDLARTDAEFLRVIKRYHRYSELSHDDVPFRQLVTNSQKKYPGNLGLTQLAFQVMLQEGRAKDVIEAARSEIKSEPVQALVAEAYLRLGEKPEDIEKVKSFAGYFTPRDAQSVESLLAAYDALHEPRFVLDAVLLCMEKGDLQKASQLSETKLNDQEFDEPAGLVAWENNRLQIAALRLASFAGKNPERTDIDLLLGDIYLVDNKLSRAAEYYERATSVGSKGAPEGFVNLAYIMQQQNLDEKARFVLEQACKVFPDDPMSVTEYAKFLARNGEREKALKILDEFSKRFPEERSVLLTRLVVKREGTPASTYVQQLQEYFYEHPDDELSAQLLVFSILRYRNLSQARDVMVFWKDATGGKENAWITEADGIMLAMEGELVLAEKMLQNAARLSGSWDFHFTHAVVLRELGALKQGLTACENALERTESDPTATDADKAKILVLKAFIEIARNDYQAAKITYGEVMSKDPANPDVWNLTQKLGLGRKNP